PAHEPPHRGRHGIAAGADQPPPAAGRGGPAGHGGAAGRRTPGELVGAGRLTAGGPALRPLTASGRARTTRSPASAPGPGGRHPTPSAAPPAPAPLTGT